MTIGQRAYECIKKRAFETGTTFKYQVELLSTTRSTVNVWKRGEGNPTSFFIAEMYRQGYDIIWILTGEKSDGN